MGSDVAARQQDTRLAALAEYDILDTPAEETFDAIVLTAAKCFDVRRAAVGFLGPHGQWLKSWIGPMRRLCPPQHSFCAYAIGQNLLLVVGDATKDARFADYPAVMGPNKLRFYAGAPIRTPSGTAIGTVCVIGAEPRPHGISEQEGALLTTLAEKVSAQLELRRVNRIQEQLADCSDVDPSQDAGAESILTARQTEVLTWASQGKSACETATILGISTRTVRFHLVAACERLGVTRTTKALALALDRGLISSPTRKS